MGQHIQPLLSGANLGGLLGFVRLIPTVNLTTPPFVWRGQLIQELQLIDESNFYDVWFSPGSGQFSEEGDTTDQGVLYKQKISLNVPRNILAVAQTVEELLQLRDFVVVCQDGNGQRYVLGSIAWPLRLNTSLDTGQRYTDSNSRTLQLTSDNPVAAALYPYNMPFPPATDLPPGGTPLPGYPGGGGGGTDRIRKFIATATVEGIHAGDEVAVVDDATGNSMEIMLTPDSPASATLQASNPLRQRGSSTAVSLAYSVTPGTNPIAKVIVAGQEQKHADGSPKLAGTVSTTTAANTDTTFQVVATDSTGAVVQASASVQYQSKRFWGGMPQDPFSLSDVQLSAVLRALSQEFSPARQQSMAVTLVEQFVVVARPASQGIGSYKVNGLPNNAFSGKTFQFTNSDGFVEQFRIERSAVPDSGAFNLTIE